MTKEELIAALEKAEGPSDGTDVLIAQHIGWWFDQSACWWRDEKNQMTDYAMCPKFTSSIDAALTLVPESLEWQVQMIEPLDYSAWVTGGLDGELFEATAPTPAIALCIAALKAR